MPVAEIIAIGTELLLGEIQDTNTAFLARKLRDLGVDIYRATLIGDNEARIADLIIESSKRASIIITTGGLGPTVDDPTREAVARAVEQPLEFRDELWNQILNRFERFHRHPTENNKKQAFVPRDAIAIENPVGTAPSFYVDMGDFIIVSLPGVPREMEAIFQESVTPYLKGRFNLSGVILVRVLHLAGVGESVVDEWIADFELGNNPTVGLAAKSGQIDVRMTAKASSNQEAEMMINNLEPQLREKLKDYIFGVDDDTIEDIVLRNIEKQSLKLAVLETSSNQTLINRLKPAAGINDPILNYYKVCDVSSVEDEISIINQKFGRTLILVSNLEIGKSKHVLDLRLISPRGENSSQRFFGGPPGTAPTWASTNAMDFLLRSIVN